MKEGRPTKYNDEMVDKVEEYLLECEDGHKLTTSSSGHPIYTPFVKIPTIEGLAVYLRLSKDTIYEWRKIHPQFSDVIGHLLNIQAERLVNNGLNGTYNSTISKVLLTKHGYRDSQELTGAEGQPLKISFDEAFKK